MIPPNTPAYSIIIPAYNEEERIRGLLRQMPGRSGRFIVVCDGTDTTPEIVRAFSRENPDLDLVCLTFSRRLGKGGAVREGFARAAGPLAGFMDADGSTSILQMEELIAAFDGADGIIGSRWLPGSVIPVRQGIARRIESRAFNLLVRLLFSLPYSDTQCGAKVFKKSAVDAVLGDMVSTGFEFDVELLWRLSRKGFLVKEYPITWENQEASTVRGPDIFRMLSALVSLRLGGAGR
ncbi:MAG: glycosyltransferase family 2 protein [Methanomicrobiales archaeon]|nr:glycosyltransferase family 2 protein [Methanomicrobiales archaeon]NYT20175.1 glycosyltransferase family 2 protein [Methanomicrobiales archaeon]